MTAHKQKKTSHSSFKNFCCSLQAYSENFYHKNKPATLVTGISVLVLGAWMGFYSPALSKKENPPKKPIPVVIAKARCETVPVYLQALGSVQPLESIVIRPQVSGQLLKLFVEDGALVQKGQLLAEIDARPYQAQLAQAEGTLEKDTALLLNARLDLERYKTLFSQDSISKQALDTQIYLVKQYEGTVKADKGAVENARINLSYCKITSPTQGRLGFSQVYPGSLVQANDPQGIFTLNTMAPVNVIFALPEDNLPTILQQIQAGKALKVLTYDRAQNQLLTTGQLQKIDNQIDPTTGTVKFKAEFSNDPPLLFPNQFVNVKLQIEELQQATVIPTAAIQHSSQGPLVFVIDNNQKAQLKHVTLGPSSEGNTVVLKEITPGDNVVVEGADKLTPEAPVTVTPLTPLTTGSDSTKLPSKS